MTPSIDVAAAADHLRVRGGSVPGISIVLGSGLGALEAALSDPIVIPFDQMPGYPAVSVEGHEGRYVMGRLSGVDVLLQCGRFHYYEGHAGGVVAAPVRVAAALGVRGFIFTNAAGAIRPDLGPGDFVLLADHLNLMSTNPLVGPVRAGEARFPDMSSAYDPDLRRLAVETARELQVALGEGTYAAMLGPSYETPAEVRMLAGLGADVVGMSTVPEVIVARALGLRCLALSVVTNHAAGLTAGALSHQEVLEVGREASEVLAQLLAQLVPRISEELYSGSTK